MTGRGLRARAPVNYNDKQEQMEPAWLKKLKSTQSSTPPKKVKKVTKTSEGSAEKENSKERKNAPKPKSAAKEKQAGPSKEAEPLEKIKKVPKSTKADKTPKEPARGRNAGMTVVPIVEKKEKAAKAPAVPSKQQQEPSSKAAALPKPPSEPKEVPGIPGVVLKAAADVPKPSAARPGSAKRKSSIAPSPKLPAVSKRPPSPLAEVQAAKKHRHEAAPVASTRPRANARTSVVQALPSLPSPEPLHLSPLPPNEIADQLEEMRENFAKMAGLVSRLQEENAELKSARIRDDVEEVVAQQATYVLQHGEKASQLAQHWKEEAERMAELVEQLRGGTIQNDLRTSNGELATARQALLDMDVSAAQREKALVELQKRNKFLERHARVPNTEDKCVGTDPPVGVNTWVQVPHGMEMMQARAFVPEGAAGSSLYIAGGGAGIGGHDMRAYPDGSFTLKGQRTVAYATTGSDMQIASRGRAGMPGTRESVPNRNTGSRRMSAPAAPLIGPDGMPRQVQFYSNSASGGLAAVTEEDEHEHEALHAGVGIISAEEAQLMATCGMIAATVPGGKTMYTHPLTGYRFEIGPAPPDTDEGEADSVAMDLQYRPIAFGTAQTLIRSIPNFGEHLLSDFEFASGNRIVLMKSIVEGLQLAQ